MMSVTIAQFMQRQTYAFSWNRLLFRDKLKFFNLWFIITIIGNLFQMLGVIISFINVIDAGLPLVIGFGCFLAWINILRYMVENTDSYIAIRSLQYSSEVLLPYIAGVVPIYMAFVFLGMSLFWSSGIFTTVSESMATTFALTQQDSFLSTMSALEQVNNFLGMLYTVAFSLFFVCVVNNIFIAIIAESYKITKVHSHTQELDEGTKVESHAIHPMSPSSPNRLSWRRSKKEESLSIFRNFVTGMKSMKQTLLDDAVQLGKTLQMEIEDILREIKTIRQEANLPTVSQRVAIFLNEQLPSMLEFYREEVKTVCSLESLLTPQY
jgi:hypothetical protein